MTVLYFTDYEYLFVLLTFYIEKNVITLEVSAVYRFLQQRNSCIFRRELRNYYLPFGTSSANNSALAFIKALVCTSDNILKSKMYIICLQKIITS